MELLHTFAVDLPAQQMWEVVTDPERVIPCLPGAALTAVNGHDCEGAFKVELGPASLRYEGASSFVDRNDSMYSVVIKGTGKDVRGQGNVSVSITPTRFEHGSGTEARVLIDLGLSGRAAQFGRGVIGEVSRKLLAQFVQNVEQAVAAGPLTEGAPQQVKSIEDVEPLDVAGTMGGLLAKYLLPAAGVSAVLVGALIAVRRRPAQRRAAEIPGLGQSVAGQVPQWFSVLITLIPQRS